MVLPSTLQVILVKWVLSHHGDLHVAMQDDEEDDDEEDDDEEDDEDGSPVIPGLDDDDSSEDDDEDGDEADLVQALQVCTSTVHGACTSSICYSIHHEDDHAY